MSDDTKSEPRPPRPDATEAQEAAETRARETIRDLDAGLVTRRSAVEVKRAAKRAIGGHDLSRGLGNIKPWP